MAALHLPEIGFALLLLTFFATHPQAKSLRVPPVLTHQFLMRRQESLPDAVNLYGRERIPDRAMVTMILRHTRTPSIVSSTNGRGAAIISEAVMILRDKGEMESGNPPAFGGLGHRPVIGDFEITVDFGLVSFSVPSTGDKFAGLQVTKVSDGSYVATIERYNRYAPYSDCPPATVNYKAWTAVSANCDANVAWTATTDIQGRFRITRQGTLLKMYYWSGSWVELQSGTVTGDDLKVAMYAATANGDNSAFDVRFDDFALNDEFALYTCGDATGDGEINVGDAVYIINYVFKGGPEPIPLEAGDANCDGNINVGDAVHIINYVFKGGAEPCCP